MTTTLGYISYTCTRTCKLFIILAVSHKDVNLLIDCLFLFQVDQLYLYHSDTRVSIEQETRLNCSQKEIESWRKEQSEDIIGSSSEI